MANQEMARQDPAATANAIVPARRELIAPRNPIDAVRYRMGGRWSLAWPVAVALGVLGLLLGVLTAPVSYASRGYVEVTPYIQATVNETPETGLMPMFEAFLASQAEFLRSDRVLREAYAHPDVQAGDLTYGRFVDNLEIGVIDGTQLIAVDCRDPRADRAMHSCNAVLAAYEQMLPTGDYESRQQHLVTLVDATRAAIDELQQSREQLLAARGRSADVERALDEHWQELSDLEAERRELRRELRRRGVIEGDVVLFDGARAEPSQLELDLIDPQLPGLRDRIATMEAEVRDLASRYRPSMRVRRDAETRLDETRSDYVGRLALAREHWNQGGRTDRPRLGTTQSVRTQLETIVRDIAAVEAAIKEVRVFEGELASIDRRLATLGRELEERSDRLDTLVIERDAIREGRVRIWSRGELPTSPRRDRRTFAAVTGLLGGLGLGFGAFFLIGSMDRRAFEPEQLGSADPSIKPLGILPELPQNLDEEMRETASACVHRIRNRIEIARRDDDARVIAVTSPYQGDGKTSLAMALGWSYSLSGLRTLMIDGDLVGEALTGLLGAGDRPGLREALSYGYLEDEISGTGNENLFFLGTGVDRRVGAAAMTPLDLGRLFDSLRDRFDVILVDSGPLLASVDALPIVSAADAAVIAVRRGRAIAKLRQCRDEVEAAGTRSLGVVLNFAERRSAERYSSLSRQSLVLASDNGMPAAHAVQHLFVDDDPE